MPEEIVASQLQSEKDLWQLWSEGGVLASDGRKRQLAGKGVSRVSKYVKRIFSKNPKYLLSRYRTGQINSWGQAMGSPDEDTGGPESSTQRGAALGKVMWGRIEGDDVAALRNVPDQEFPAGRSLYR